ncbi:uncharacterized protein BO80DRAFT_436674 [Aspergillus ibericus CBS 121593]|uniref:Uncharacterized protein n=1 Tax=Aspergillus ibericus CBS 121593 TaxID=1448316 RepID=A0A395GTA9_9EURO|nr:hypothetical protein BO80DRAFT_436674 [Aspergillus ibericus CBS 121593]RAK98765.1 hypothetical protein BO80DRAFT_436674 [Aspergillus ibericus CBS 121593]
MDHTTEMHLVSSSSVQSDNTVGQQPVAVSIGNHIPAQPILPQRDTDAAGPVLQDQTDRPAQAEDRDLISLLPRGEIRRRGKRKQEGGRSRKRAGQPSPFRCVDTRGWQPEVAGSGWTAAAGLLDERRVGLVGSGVLSFWGSRVMQSPDFVTVYGANSIPCHASATVLFTQSAGQPSTGETWRAVRSGQVRLGNGMRDGGQVTFHTRLLLTGISVGTGTKSDRVRLWGGMRASRRD